MSLLFSLDFQKRSAAPTSENQPAHDGESVFRHACKMGLEGIVSKQLGLRYRAGRSKDWLKFKNPEAPGGEARAGRGLEPGAMAMKKTEKTRTHFTFRIDTWTADGEGIV